MNAIFSKALTGVKNVAGYTNLKVSAKSPQILFVAGVALIGTGVVAACKATLKADELLDNLNEDISQVKENYEKNDKVYSKELAKAYFTGVRKIAKTYAPAILALTGGIACMGYSNHILNKRNVALLAAYNTLDDGFKKYRSRVISELGEEADRRFNYGTETKDEITYNDTDEEGKTKKKKVKKAEVLKDPLLDGCSPYAVLFAPWTTDAYTNADCYNETFIRVRQNIANDVMSTRRGHWYLYSEVLDGLGIDPTPIIGRSGKSALEVGWVEGNGDGYIDLHPTRVFAEYEGETIPVWIIDPNVDGYILDKVAGINQAKDDIINLEDNHYYQYVLRTERDD